MTDTTQPMMEDGRPAFKAQCIACGGSGETPSRSPEGGFPCNTCEGRGWYPAPDTRTYRSVCTPYRELPPLAPLRTFDGADNDARSPY